MLSRGQDYGDIKMNLSQARKDYLSAVERNKNAQYGYKNRQQQRTQEAATACLKAEIEARRA